MWNTYFAKNSQKSRLLKRLEAMPINCWPLSAIPTFFFFRVWSMTLRKLVLSSRADTKIKRGCPGLGATIINTRSYFSFVFTHVTFFLFLVNALRTVTMSYFFSINTSISLQFVVTFISPSPYVFTLDYIVYRVSFIFSFHSELAESNITREKQYTLILLSWHIWLRYTYIALYVYYVF